MLNFHELINFHFKSIKKIYIYISIRSLKICRSDEFSTIRYSVFMEIEYYSHLPIKHFFLLRLQYYVVIKKVR